MQLETIMLLGKNKYIITFFKTIVYGICLLPVAYLQLLDKSETNKNVI
jgi:hypothetical protein